MPNKNAIKGKGFERELVKYFESVGYLAKRAWGSNGEAMGEHKDVDLLVISNSLVRRYQCKRTKQLPKWLGMSSFVDGVLIREDHGETFILMPLKKYIKERNNE